MTKKKAPQKETAPRQYDKEQLLGAAPGSAARDVLAAVLEDNKTYTKDQATALVEKYLKGKV